MEAASLGLFAEVSAAQHEVRKRRTEAERRVHKCAAPMELHAALAAAMMLGDPESSATSPGQGFDLLRHYSWCST